MNEKSLEEIFSDLEEKFGDTSSLVRVVLSGRRRNMQTAHERIDMRPVEIKGEIQVQVSHSDGRQMTTKNYLPAQAPFSELIRSGYANILLEGTTETLSLRITKKGEPLIHREVAVKEQELSHDRSKSRLLDPSDPFLIAVGISDSNGNVKPSKTDKYKQVEEFLRLLTPTLTAAIAAGHIHTPTDSDPLAIVDLGCGHAYLTFAAHQYLRAQGIPVKVIGIDVRSAARDRNNKIAKDLGIESTIEFRAEEISDTKLEKADVAIALHACDTATDDAIAWAINQDAKLALLAPCCHHDIQSQMHQIPEPWSLVTRNGIMKERLGDLLTDAIRMQIMKLKGYRVEAIEFIGGEHTPRNLMIRAVKTGATPDPSDEAKYEEMLALWKVKPALASLINR
ncbi:MAG: SAM-dependent methyltransferase [Candidatus Planktophila sp.]|nr:SAM-dependent methyltransferase [Candidatus Planktophila sp.]